MNGVFTATISASDCGCRDATSASPHSSRTSPPWYRVARDIASPRTQVFWCGGSSRLPSAATSDFRCRRRFASVASYPWRTPVKSSKDHGAWSSHLSWDPIPAKFISMFICLTNIFWLLLNLNYFYVPWYAYLIAAGVVTRVETYVPIEKVAHAI